MADPDVPRAGRAPRWDPRALPDLTGRTYLITGSNAGLGYFASEQLAAAGASVMMSGRNPNRIAAAKAAVLRQQPDARVETILLDTSNYGSVRAAAASIRYRGNLDGVLLNAGIVHPPTARETTRDGHEVVFATNALGHFALAGALLPTLVATAQKTDVPSRLVWVGSMSTGMWRYDPVDPHLSEGYSAWRAYVQSKVAAAALGFEADRRLREAGVPVASLVAHPGYSIGGRTRGIRGVNEPHRIKRFLDNLQTPIAQSKEFGAWSLVRALVDPGAEGGQYWGPRFGPKGAPRAGRPPAITRDAEVAERLWRAAEESTGVRWRLSPH